MEYFVVCVIFDDYMVYFFYILKVVGFKYIGVGVDWDGGGGVECMMDVVVLLLIIERFLVEGYIKEDL